MNKVFFACFLGLIAVTAHAGIRPEPPDDRPRPEPKPKPQGPTSLPTNFVSIFGRHCDTDCYVATRLCAPKPPPFGGEVCFPSPEEAKCNIDKAMACRADAEALEYAVPAAAATTASNEHGTREDWNRACQELAAMGLGLKYLWDMAHEPGYGSVLAANDLAKPAVVALAAWGACWLVGSNTRWRNGG